VVFLSKSVVSRGAHPYGGPGCQQARLALSKGCRIITTKWKARLAGEHPTRDGHGALTTIAYIGARSLQRVSPIGEAASGWTGSVVCERGIDCWTQKVLYEEVVHCLCSMLADGVVRV